MMINWKSIHIYPNDNDENSTIDSLISTVDFLTEERQIDIFFFIRYSDPQPHIRFRFDSRVSGKDHLQHFYSAFKNASFVLREYQPEIHRYGGPYFCWIAERQFYYSSKTCLSAIKKFGSRKWNYSLAVSLALQMHLSMLFAFQFKQSQAVSLLKHITWRWSSFNCTSDYDITMMLDDFNTLLNREMNTVNFIVDLWRSLHQNSLGVSDIINWVNNMREIYTLLQRERQYHFLNVSSEFLFESTEGDGDSHLFAFCDSLIHMTNNRLGIRNEDEAYLAFVLWNSLNLIHGD